MKRGCCKCIYAHSLAALLGWIVRNSHRFSYTKTNHDRSLPSGRRLMQRNASTTFSSKLKTRRDDPALTFKQTAASCVVIVLYVVKGTTGSALRRSGMIAFSVSVLHAALLLRQHSSQGMDPSKFRQCEVQIGLSLFGLLRSTQIPVEAPGALL